MTLPERLLELAKKASKRPFEWRESTDHGVLMRTLSPGILVLDNCAGSGGPWGDEIDRANAKFILAAANSAEHLARIALAAADLLRAEDDEDAPLSITEFHDAIDRATVTRAALRQLLEEMNRGQ